MKIKQVYKRLITSSAILTAFGTLHADVGKDIETAIGEITNGGKVNLDVRARYEYTDIENATPGSPTDDNGGFNLRTRLGFTTASYNGFQAMVEFEHIAFVDGSDGNVLDTNDENDDPEINQLWLSYEYEDIGSTKLGRQIYTLDDHRFIGHVGWRQNIQTFDGITGKLSPVEGLLLQAAFLNRVNRVNGLSVEMDTFTINGSYKVADYLTLTGFGYFIQKEASGFALLSSDTIGIRASGKYPIDDLTLSYSASFANQTDNDASKNTTLGNRNFDNNYYAFDAMGAYQGFTFGGGVEVLEGDGTTGFSTPLATVHKFQGYADVFAGPSLTGALSQGIVNYYIKGGYKIPVGNGIALNAAYHVFEAENIDQDLGQEFDFTVGYKLNKYLSFLAKAAFYDGEPGATYGFAATDKTLFTFDTTLVF